MEACIQEYETDEQAMQGIKKYLTAFYQDNYGEEFSRSKDLEKAIAAVQNAFSENIFPRMKVDWQQYPDNIGHMTSPGCYRCHDGKHTSEDGQTISHQCEACHTITSQGPEDNLAFSVSPSGLDFQHPVDIDEAWKEMGCYECHSTPPLDF